MCPSRVIELLADTDGRFCRMTYPPSTSPWKVFPGQKLGGGDVVTHGSDRGGLRVTSWVLWSLCKLRLWLNQSLLWHFLFLSPVIARFAHLLPLSLSGRCSDTLAGALSASACRAWCVSSLVCAASSTSNRAPSAGVWAQRPGPHSGSSHSHLFPLFCSLMTLCVFKLQLLFEHHTDPASY